MTWLISLATGVLVAVLGAVALGFLADRWTVWFRVSNFEGAAGYYVLMYGLLGAIGGFVVGVLCSRHVVEGSDAHFARGILLSGAWVAGIWTALAAFTYAIADHAPTLKGRRLTLDLEIRTPPPNALLADPAPKPMVSLENASGRTTSYGVVQVDPTTDDRGRRIVAITLPLRSSSSSRTVRVRWSEDLSFTIGMPLRGKPTEEDFAWSVWLAPLEVARKGAWSAAEADVAFAVRYRVGYPQPEPPRPSEAEVAAAKKDEERARIAALPANAPVRDWLPFTRYGVSEENQKAVLESLRKREGLAAEFAALVVDEDAEIAAEALRLVPRLPGPADPFVEPVAAAGRDLLKRLNRVVETPKSQDPGYEGAAGISIRFSGWMAAVFHLRKEARGDFTAELRPILAAARKRPDSEALRRDVVRVASFHLHEWAGDAPHPSDPPPR